MKLTFTLEQVIVLGTLVFGLGGNAAITHYKISALEDQVSEINGALQYVLAEGIREGRYQAPPGNWVFPKE